MVLTGLRPDARLSGCVIVEVDGSRIASLPVEIVVELGLVAGQELAPERHEVLLRAAGAEAARRVALRLLAVRPHSTVDISRKLRDRNHDAESIKAAIIRLEASGLLDDDEFARHYVRVRAPRGHGPSRLIHDLLSRGVDRGVAERAVAEVTTSEAFDPTSAARRLVEKRAVALRSLAVPARRRRMLAYLSRRGFRGTVIREMVEELLGGPTVR